MNKDKTASIIGIMCSVVTLFAFSFLYIIIEIHPLLQTLFVMFALGMCLIVGVVVWQILAGDVDLDRRVLGEIAIISGAAILGATLVKALFKKDTLIYRCSTCNLVVMKGASRCRRCGLTWSISG